MASVIIEVVVWRNETEFTSCTFRFRRVMYYMSRSQQVYQKLTYLRLPGVSNMLVYPVLCWGQHYHVSKWLTYKQHGLFNVTWQLLGGAYSHSRCVKQCITPRSYWRNSCNTNSLTSQREWELDHLTTGTALKLMVLFLWTYLIYMPNKAIFPRNTIIE